MDFRCNPATEKEMFMKARYLLRKKLIFVLCVSCTLSATLSRASGSGRSARQILDSTGVRGGLIVHIGCSDGSIGMVLSCPVSCLGGKR